jgi:hypothetical protein
MQVGANLCGGGMNEGLPRFGAHQHTCPPHHLCSHGQAGLPGAMPAFPRSFLRLFHPDVARSTVAVYICVLCCVVCVCVRVWSVCARFTPFACARLVRFSRSCHHCSG